MKKMKEIIKVLSFIIPIGGGLFFGNLIVRLLENLGANHITIKDILLSYSIPTIVCCVLWYGLIFILFSKKK